MNQVRTLSSSSLPLLLEPSSPLLLPFFGHHQVQFHPSNSNVWELMDNQNSLTMIARGMVYKSVICLLWFPGGLANIGKIVGDWVFLHADLVALYISMATLVAGMNMGPTFWKKMEKLARKAMGIAIVAMGIAAHHIILMVVGNDYWLGLFVNGSGILSMVLTCVSIFILNS
ncbi:unnamed protein product [Lactuca saligna]|uniref:Uncharacterized protein n=1 Tax=Lactuca saligna TaxID=75948 RepID=A0AA36A418_LACSI|nr:unnamed protein product [Lactuca saligna]